MIVQNCLLTFGYGAGAEVRQLKCTLRLGKKIAGDIDEELDYDKTEVIDGHWITFKLDNFNLTLADAEWLADYVYATDKTIGYDDMTFSVVNDIRNHELEFEPIKGSNARATCELEFIDAELHGRTRETVPGEIRETVDGKIRETTRW